MPTELQKFKKWASELSKNDTLLAHFYIAQKKTKEKGKVVVKSIIDPPDYFVFNTLSKEKCWQIKGTTGHGKCGKRYPVPVLNCWKIDTEFFNALKEYYKHQSDFDQYKYGIILSKNKLARVLSEVVEVTNYKGEKINSKNCWYFDVPSYKFGPLRPFSFCKVVRAKMPYEHYTGEPIFKIPAQAIVGVMVQYGEKEAFRQLLNQKGMGHVKLFSL
jgi:hypothetical protein